MSASFNDRLRLAVVGPITGGSLPVAAASARAFALLGHETTFIDNQIFAPALAACKSLPQAQRSAAEVEVFLRAAAATKQRLCEVRPQVTLFLAQAPVLSEDDLAPLRERDAPSVFWFVEDFRVFTYWQRAAPRFDHVWAIQRDPFVQLLAQAGVRHVDYVPLACEPWQGPKPETPAGDITFVGTGYPNRVARLSALGEPSLRIYGPMFAREPRLAPQVDFDGVLPHERLAPIFASSRINLNLSSTIDPGRFDERKDFVNPRTFEICGAGGFQLAERNIPLEEHFEPEVEVSTFGSDEEARDKIRFFLTHEEARLAVARRGADRARLAHTYAARLQAALGRLLARDGDRVARAA